MGHVKDLKTGIKYKNTPIGKIPVDWSLKSVGEVCDILDSRRIPLNKEQRDKMRGSIPYYGANGVVDYINDSIFEDDLILMAEDGGYFEDYKNRPIAYLIHGKSWVNNHAHVLKVKEPNNTSWVFYSLAHKNIVPFIKGGTRSKLNQQELRQILFPLPPLSEQEEIADILKTVDEAIEKTDQIIEKTKEVKEGLMQTLFTRGIGHKKFKKTEIGEIPVEWEVGKISNYGEIVTGNTPPTNVPKYYGSEYPFVSPFDLGSKKTIVETEKYLSKEGFSVSRSLPPNSVLVVCIGSTIGKTGIAGTELATNQQINSIICKNSDYNFVYYYTTFINQQFKQLAGTQAVPIINKGNFSTVKVAIPPLDEQKKIGDILSSIDDEIEKEMNHREQLEALKKGLMQVLLIGKIRVIM